MLSCYALHVLCYRMLILNCLLAGVARNGAGSNAGNRDVVVLGVVTKSAMSSCLPATHAQVSALAAARARAMAEGPATLVTGALTGKIAVLSSLFFFGFGSGASQASVQYHEQEMGGYIPFSFS